MHERHEKFLKRAYTVNSSGGERLSKKVVGRVERAETLLQNINNGKTREMSFEVLIALVIDIAPSDAVDKAKPGNLKEERKQAERVSLNG